jgi:hypothetical protein
MVRSEVPGGLVPAWFAFYKSSSRPAAVGGESALPSHSLKTAALPISDRGGDGGGSSFQQENRPPGLGELPEAGLDGEFLARRPSEAWLTRGSPYPERVYIELPPSFFLNPLEPPTAGPNSSEPL